MKKKKYLYENIIYFYDFKKFWYNPIIFYYNKILKKEFNYYLNYNLNNNLIINYKTKLKIIKYLLINKVYKLNNLFKYFFLKKNKMYNKYYILIWNKIKQDLILLVNKIKKNENINIIKYKNIKYCFNINKISIINIESNIFNDKLIICKPKILDYMDGFIFYLQHLSWCIYKNINNKNHYNIIYGLKNTLWKFSFIKKKLAKKILSFYIKGYCLGINNPLFLTYKTVNIFLKFYFSKNKKKNILNDNLLNILLGNNYYVGEINNNFFLKNYFFNNNLNIKKLIFNINKWIVPIFKKK